MIVETTGDAVRPVWEFSPAMATVLAGFVVSTGILILTVLWAVARIREAASG